MKSARCPAIPELWGKSIRSSFSHGKARALLVGTVADHGITLASAGLACSEQWSATAAIHSSKATLGGFGVVPDLLQ